MQDRLAIIILGEQNSGKTSTLRSYSDYYHKEVSTLKKGFRYGVSPFKPKYWGIKVFTYILPSSPTESGIPLIASKGPQNWFADLVLMAEQLNGSEYSNSIHYLMTHQYHIKEFVVSNHVGDGVWDRWDVGDNFRMNAKLLQRREEIGDYIRNFITRKITTGML